MPGFSCFIQQPFAEQCNKHLLGEKVHSFTNDVVAGQLNAIIGNVGYQYCETQHVCAYLHGDIFSGLDSSDALKVLVLAHENDALPQALAKANGYFAFMLYDKGSNKAYFATDRYGMKPIYFWKQNGQVAAVANELKALAVHPDFELQPDKSAIDAFTGLGQMLENQTWFESSERLGPSCLLTVDCNDRSYQIAHYWTWKSVTKKDSISFDEATDKLYELYVQAMERCLSSVKGSTLAITLSGGLDSRVLLAEAAKQFSGTIETFTFGIEGCEDSIIAKQVSDVAGVTNHFRPINKDNWFSGRESGVWTSEGMFNIVHMHTLGSVQAISDFSPYLLNGYCGDAVIGGSYLLEDALNQPPTQATLEVKYGKYAKYIDLTNPYYGCGCTDPAMVVSNRGIRFVASGTDLLADRLHNLKPFMDTDLLDFVYSLPDEYRYKSRLYNAMLLKYYPEYFSTIPWQNTGKVIDVDWQPSEGVPKRTLKQLVVDQIKGTRFENAARRWYQKLNTSNKNYASYPEWMRDKEFVSYLDSVFSHASSLNESTLFDADSAKLSLQAFVKDYNVKPETVGGWLTFALYMQMLSATRE